MADKPQSQCIYCGSWKDKLSREHVIADGLKGTIVLPNASCEVCRDVTSAIELHCLRKMFVVFRNTTGLYSKKHKKRRGSSSDFTITIEENGVETVTEVPINEAPAAFLELHLPVPGLINGAAPTTETQVGFGVRALHTDYQERVMKLGDAGLAFTHFELRPRAFLSMLGKIAYSFAIKQLGRDSFTPLVQPLCLNTETRPNTYVGGDWKPPIETPDRPHDLRFYEHDEYVVVRVQLFSEYTSHAYVVVVGTKLEASNAV
ncbi:hypothetical protein [Caballeronia sp. TF1N1]|uniref:hypothetical protein n=1 Tax=Caballeronia sp. TF1N1 TaxID=2878153 RepID=UPI001FD4BC4B|nr:hypothetical protein [Caballeronia sp. TF1N1]